ncbi:MAG: hypothetical protein V7643_2213 [Mycobacterium sp.]|jgi:hypothetical protein
MATKANLRSAFQECLNGAITHGQRPSRWIGLGQWTCTAIDAVAQEHPDATADHIADAYDAFAREHEPSNQQAPPAQPPKRLEARRGRFHRA